MKMKNNMKKKSFNRFLKSEKGSPKDIIFMVLIIVLAVSALAAIFVPMINDTKTSASKIEKVQRGINMNIDNSDAVNGSVVLQEIADPTDGATVSVFRSDGTTSIPNNEIVRTAMFVKSLTYDVDGNVATITFTQIDMN
jgi:type II secretory pathway pseudopilin PulG